MESRKLRLAKETLVELNADEMRVVAGGSDGLCGTDLCNPCVFTWSCDDIKTMYCLQTRKGC